MSALSWAGAIGLGLVWGWWTALRAESPSTWSAIFLILSAAIVQAAESAWLTGLGSVGALFGAWLVGFLLHRAFRTALRAISQGG